MSATSSPATKAPATKPGDHEEPELAQEESVPSDDKDEVGEMMIEDLGHDLSRKKKG